MLVSYILATICEKEHITLGDILSQDDPYSNCSGLHMLGVFHYCDVVCMGISVSVDYIFFVVGVDNVVAFHSMALLEHSHLSLSGIL